MQGLRSLLFVGQMYLMMPVLALVFTLPALFSRDWAFRGIHAYASWVRWTARWMVGIETEIRGIAPTGEVLVAAKHQSFLDILMIISALPRPKFVMKASLRWAPVLGWYALRIGCIPVNRGRRARAVEQMVAGVRESPAGPGQLVIYPQGTRVAPGAHLPYKIGTGVLYAELGQPLVPAATNVGVFWPRTGILRRPGRAVVEFLPEVPPGRPVPEIMAALERDVEAASNRLMREAGFAGPLPTAGAERAGSGEGGVGNAPPPPWG
jgi:1-acyl-sn-glycerol-3-phosphate acyltransferase